MLDLGPRRDGAIKRGPVRPPSAALKIVEPQKLPFPAAALKIALERSSVWMSIT